MSGLSPKFSAEERRTVWLICSACQTKFHPKTSTKKGAIRNQCSKKCQMDETRKRFDKSWSLRQRYHA